MNFQDFWIIFSTSSGYFLLVGDLNFHVDSPDSISRRFLSTLRSFNLLQHVDVATHVNGHTLDLVITRKEETFASDFSVFNFAISDHHMICCRLGFHKKRVLTRKLSLRCTRTIDMDQFCSDLDSSDLVNSSLDNDLSVLIESQFYSPVTARPSCPY